MKNFYKHKDGSVSMRATNGDFVTIDIHEIINCAQQYQGEYTLLEQELMRYTHAYSDPEDFIEAIEEKAQIAWNNRFKKTREGVKTE